VPHHCSTRHTSSLAAVLCGPLSTGRRPGGGAAGRTRTGPAGHSPSGSGRGSPVRGGIGGGELGEHRLGPPNVQLAHPPMLRDTRHGPRHHRAQPPHTDIGTRDETRGVTRGRPGQPGTTTGLHATEREGTHERSRLDTRGASGRHRRNRTSQKRGRAHCTRVGALHGPRGRRQLRWRPGDPLGLNPSEGRAQRGFRAPHSSRACHHRAGGGRRGSSGDRSASGP
jgi:hypothetical protein